jgi:hypothetical protein
MCERFSRPVGLDLQVPEQENGRHGETNANESIVERCDSQVSINPSHLNLSKAQLTSQRRPRDQRHRNPNQIGISVKRPALHQIRTLAPKPLKHSPQPQRDEKRISINQPSGSAQQLEVIREMLFASTRQVLTNRSGQEEDYDDCGSDPEGAVEVWVALEDVEEVLTRVEGGAAAGEDLIRVDVEELLVEGDAPEEALGGGLLAGAWGAEEGACVGLDFGGAGGVVVEGCLGSVRYSWLPPTPGVGIAYWSCGTRGCLLGGRYGLGRPVPVLVLGFCWTPLSDRMICIPQHLRRPRHRILVCSPWLSMVSYVIE